MIYRPKPTAQIQLLLHSGFQTLLVIVPVCEIFMHADSYLTDFYRCFLLAQ